LSARLIDLAHVAPTQQRLDLVVADGFTRSPAQLLALDGGADARVRPRQTLIIGKHRLGQASQPAAVIFAQRQLAQMRKSSRLIKGGEICYMVL
jgi:hypothetical protein